MPKSKRSVRKVKAPLPGPADYSNSIYRSSGPRFVIGIKTNKVMNLTRYKTPGVGEYDLINNQNTHKKLPAYSFGTASRTSGIGASSLTQAPSPMSYSPNKPTKKAPRAIMP